ncbi:hypothetical protein X943_000861 [Babesia divergens]|uniref:Uncharacterized protein n=1 Tax=Babesia divergens TaxID=32595 RepID=A0AAD9G8Z5_BABDI|nr:hypothetical protein X943_000861 [Babesia divergens]
MKLLGILRASGLCLLAIGFHGQPVSCGIFKGPKKPKKDSNAKVSEISENHQESTVESSSQESLPSSQSNLVFESSTWDDSHLASSVLFIKEFCREVQGDKFKGQISDKTLKGLSRTCSWVSSYLASFNWRLIRNLHENSYKDILKHEKFNIYAEWLNKNIPEIEKCIISMHNESLKLTMEQLMTDDFVGPYKYGFVHKQDWWTGIMFDSPSPNYIGPSFLESLNDLQKSLENILKKDPTKSTVGPRDVNGVQSNDVSGVL